MTRKKSRGFTLTEIMVVIAIIGILVGVVLVAMGPVRKRAKDARIVSDMLQLQNLAENIYLDEGNYDKVDPALSLEIAAIGNDISTQGSSLIIEKASPAYKYCAYASLVSGSYFCVDYMGNMAETATPDNSCDSGINSFTCQ